MNWTCDDTRRSLRRQDSLPDAAVEHLAQCTLCQELTELLAEGTSEEGSESSTGALDVGRLLAATHDQVAHEKGIVASLRSLSTRSRLVLGLSLALLPVVLQLPLARRGDWAQYPLERMLLAIIAYALVIVFAARSLLSPLHQPVLPWRKFVAAFVALALPLLIAATAPAYASAHVQSSPAGPLFAKQAVTCLRYGALLALPGSVVLLFMDRQQGRGRYFLPLLAALGGAVGNFVLLLHCTSEDPAHQLLGHATVGLLLFLILGFFWATRGTEPRAPS